MAQESVDILTYMGWSNADNMDEKVGKAGKIHVVTNIQNKNVTLSIFYTKQHKCIYVDSIVKTQKKNIYGVTST